VKKYTVKIYRLIFILGFIISCDTTIEIAGECEVGQIYCIDGKEKKCIHTKGDYETLNCPLFNMVCVDNVGCRKCTPDKFTCEDQFVSICASDGKSATPIQECDSEKGYVCSYGKCVQACDEAKENRSYLGCEYWAVDLDNAVVSSGSAAAQQFSVVVSNPGFITTKVRVEKNVAPYGWPPEIVLIKELDVPPEGLRIINLPAREVDGSLPGSFNTGTHSAITPNAYKITSSAPIAAYQFNPLDNYGVFSNDASILFPKTALNKSYHVLSWPQTIADTDDPNNDFNIHLRAFLTIVAIEPGTDVNIVLSTDIIGDGKNIPSAKKGETISFDLNEFDVLNLETNGFNADFTGTKINSDKNIVVFTGSEASDVPRWEYFVERRCCADHLEHQLFPESAAGSIFILGRTPARTPAVSGAGGGCAVIEEADVFRIMALYDETIVMTSMAEPDNYFILNKGEFKDVEPYCDPFVESSKPIFVGQFSRSQATTGIPLNLPGGDPSFIMVPPKEQWRDNYVFLTPDKYAFDFITITAVMGTEIWLDYLELENFECTRQRASCGTTIEQNGSYEIINCQLSFPILYPELPSGENVNPGKQNDGYHVIRSSQPVGLVVSGFDKHVSYGYVGGMDLKVINIE
jgi:IgGFc binding protein